MAKVASDSQILPSSNWGNYTRMLDREPLRSQTFNSLNLEALEAVATSHRGSKCRINKSCYAYGGDNIILEIIFEDGSVWIARLRLHEPKFLTLRGEVDKIFLTEVATLRFLQRRTKIPVPTVFAFDARFENEVGQPFMLMEGMPGRRLWGGMQTDYIPDEFKQKVYGQIADIMLELRLHPFQEIGMLYSEETEGVEASVRIGEIVDQHARLPDFGPFTNANEFYQTRGRLLYEYHKTTCSLNEQSSLDPIEASKFKMAACPYIADPCHANGPFFLTHPDFQVTNCLFDDEYNITAVLDWTGCQTLPFESFAYPPMKIVPNADQFLDWELGVRLSAERRKQWNKNRETFLAVLGTRELSQTGDERTWPSIAAMIRSPRSYFAHILNWEGIVGMPSRLPQKEFLEWSGLTGSDEVPTKRPTLEVGMK